MDAEALKRLQAKFANNDARIGGKGTPRRKRKTIQKAVATDDKKVQQALAKLGSQPIPGIEEAAIFLNDGRVIQFKAPKVQAVLASNLFAISGLTETKSAAELIDPDMLKRLGPEGLATLQKMLQQSAQGAGGDLQAAAAALDEEEDIPELVENFEATAVADADAEKQQ